MEEMIWSMFKDAQDYKLTTADIYRRLKRQRRVNRKLTILALTATVYSIMVAVNYKEVRKMIDELKDEVKELRMRGE